MQMQQELNNNSTANTVIHLMRHGEVENPNKIIYGRLPNFGLSKRGFRMVNKMADLTENPKYNMQNISYIVSSPLLRTQQSAEPFAKKFNLDINFDERVIESGSWFEGKRITIFSLIKAATLKYLSDPAIPTWGEPYGEISARMSSAIESLVEKRQGKHSLIVSHQLPIWISRLYYTNKKLYPNALFRKCTKASLTNLYFDENKKIIKVEYFQPVKNLK